jgi:hypothetical protein
VPRAGRRSEAWVEGGLEVVADVDAGAADDEREGDAERELDDATDDVEAVGAVGAGDEAGDGGAVLDVGVPAAAPFFVVVMSNAGRRCAAFSRLAHDHAIGLAVVIAKAYVPLPEMARVTSARAQAWPVTGPVTATGGFERLT